MNDLNIKNIYAWPPKPRMAVMAIIFFITIYIGYYLNISSLLTELNTTKQLQSDVKQQLESVIAKNAKLTTALSQFTNLESSLNQWRGKLIKYPELPDLLNEILKSGATNHLFFSLFNPGAGIKNGLFIKVPIKMIVVGSYAQIVDFVTQIANMQKLVAVSDFTISNENKNDILGAKLAETATAKNFLTAEIALEVYYQSEKKVNGL